MSTTSRDLRRVSRFLRRLGIETEYRDRSLSLVDTRDIGGGFNISENHILVCPHGRMNGSALRSEYHDQEWHQGIAVIVSGWGE